MAATCASSTTRRGVKRRDTHDSVIDMWWDDKPNAKRSVPDDRPEDGPVLEAAYIAAAVAARNREAAWPRIRGCQVCGLAQDKWTIGLPLLVNAANQPVQVPGFFCSKACFEHI